MNEWQLALGVTAGLITLFGFSFGVFWKIIQDAKKDLNTRLDYMDAELKIITGALAEKPSYEHVDKIFVRKETYSIQFNQIMDQFAELKNMIKKMTEK